MSKSFHKHRKHFRKTSDFFETSAHTQRSSNKRGREKERLKQEIEEVDLWWSEALPG